jgi:hypothetical protein
MDLLDDEEILFHGFWFFTHRWPMHIGITHFGVRNLNFFLPSLLLCLFA